MFGWEFPPVNSGGLGTACFGLTKALSKNDDVNITFVLPSLSEECKHDFVRLISAKNASNIKVKVVDSLLKAYITSEEYSDVVLDRANNVSGKIYGENLFQEVYKYAKRASKIAAVEEHDIIHCHDWMTFRAGIEAKKVSGKPLVVHVHATEFDRTGGSPNQAVYDIEREGMHAADHIIAVSDFTKQKIIQNYGISPDKVTVVHNAVDFNDNDFGMKFRDRNPDTKVVLFLGRITLQKGPDYFLYTAKCVLDHEPNTRFIVAGSGDMEKFMIEKAAELGIADKVLFAGFLKGEDVDKAFQMADLFVMPSVSEPFGITPLEAMRNNTPVLISNQSGVSEVITHCHKTDFWDIEEMANKIISTLRYPALKETLRENGFNEVQKFNWEDSARKCVDIYNNLARGA